MTQYEQENLETAKLFIDEELKLNLTKHTWLTETPAMKKAIIAHYSAKWTVTDDGKALHFAPKQV